MTVTTQSASDPVKPVPPGSVVVGVDGSASSHLALRWAAEQAVLEDRPLTLVHAGPADVFRDVLGTAHALVRRRARAVEVHELLRDTDARDLLVGLSRSAATIVVGSRGLGPFRSLVAGSVGLALVRQAACPVVVHRPCHPGLVRNGVVVGIDGTAADLPVLEHAFHQAGLRDLPLTVLHTTLARDGAEDLRLSETLAGTGEAHPTVRVTTEVLPGLPDDALARASGRMNLVVVGARHGWSGRVGLGSVAAALAERSRCPVAVVPLPPGGSSNDGRLLGRGQSAE